MGLRKCPRCELNYIRDDEQLCNVCKRHMKGGADDLTGSSVVDDMDGIDELEVPIDDDIPEIELEEIDKELGGDSNLGSDDMDDMDEENKEEDGEN